MEETIDELYKIYFKDTLDLIFKTNGEKHTAVPFYLEDQETKEEKKEEPIKEKVIDLSKDYHKIWKFIGANRKWNVKDKNGNFIFDDLHTQIMLLKKIIAVLDRRKWRLFSYDGKPISDEDYSEIKEFNSYLEVKKNDKYYLLDINGKTISDGYDSIGYFHHNYASVRRNGKCGFIDITGKEVTPIEYPGYALIGEHYALVKNEKGKMFAIKLPGGERINNELYDRTSLFREDVVVERNGKQNILDNYGNPINKKWYSEVSDFKTDDFNSHRYATVYDDGNYNVVDENGNEIFQKPISYGIEITVNGSRKNSLVTRIDYCGKGFFLIRTRVRSNGSIYKNMVNLKGEFISDTWVDDHEVLGAKANNSFQVAWAGKKTIVKCLNKDLAGYQVENRVLGGYRLVNSKGVINLKYEPIKVFNSNFILCLKNDKAYLFDKKRNNYEEFCDLTRIEYSDNLLRIYDKVYLIYGEHCIDITDYYHRELKGKDSYTIRSNVEIKSKEQFYIDDEKRVKEEFRKAAAKNREIRDEIKKQEQIEAVKEINKQNEIESKKTELLYLEALYNFRKSFKDMQEYAKKTGVLKRGTVDDIFVEVDGHKEIDPTLLELKVLKDIDLRFTSFKDVYVAGVDFTDTNASFDPQEVYGKCLRKCTLPSSLFNVSSKFNDVDIRGAKFTTDNNPRKFNLRIENLMEGIYDDETTLNGTPLIELIEKENERGSKIA